MADIVNAFPLSIYRDTVAIDPQLSGGGAESASDAMR